MTIPQSDGGRGQSKTRGVIAGGRYNPAKTNVMNFITMSTLGNAADFGDLQAAAYMAGKSTASSSLRMVMTMPNTPSFQAGFDFIEIATTGNAQDFGDASEAMQSNGANSNGHGGL